MIKLYDAIIPKEKDIFTEESSHDAVNNLSKKYKDLMVKSHKDWISTQKELFKQLKYDGSDESIYKIMTNKYDDLISKPLELFLKTAQEVAKYQIEYNSDDKKRIAILKTYLGKHPNIAILTHPAPIKNIGYDFSFSYISGDDIGNIYSRLREDISKKNDIKQANIYDRIHKDYRDLSKMDDYVTASMKPIIMNDKAITMKDLVDKYEDIFKNKSKLMKNNIDKFNDSYSTIEKDHKATINMIIRKMKEIKESDMEDEDKLKEYKRYMSYISITNAITQHLMDSCYLIMKYTLLNIADSDKASNKLTASVSKYLFGLNLEG